MTALGKRPTDGGRRQRRLKGERTCMNSLLKRFIRDGEVPAKSVAEAVGKPYSTLMREINPYDKGAKLGVETFMAIIETTGDPTPLKLMAYELGYRLIPDK